jgi:DNA polymerase (family 10)
MPVHNTEIADTFRQFADLLEIQEANPYRVRAYRTAAQTVSNLPRDAADMLHAGEDLSELPGIGDDLAGKIREIVRTGSLEALEEVAREMPAELTEIMQLPGLGAKRVKLIYDHLGVETLEQLAEAASRQRVRELPGLGNKTEQKILDEIGRRRDRKGRIKLAEVRGVAESLVTYLEQVQGVKQLTVAGSYRRRQETVGDLDILATCKRDSPIMDRFVEYDEVQDVVSQGKTRSTVRLRSALQVDLRVVQQVSYGAALHYFTGSKAHNIAVRKRGVQKDLKINEYGVFRGDERIAGRTEQEVYEQVDLPFIPPELRENRGEIEAAERDALPRLITLEDIRGDLHSHTRATDGHYSLEEMAEAARQQGYQYLAVTDHTKNVAMAGGLDEKRLAKQIDQIDQLNEQLSGIRLLKGSEVDILEDGSLDIQDQVLARLDLTVCSVHSHFGLSRDKQTERFLRAMDNPHCHILGHLTGRLLGNRDAYDVDVQRILKGALERGCFVELNAQPDRLDLSDVYCKLAKEMGLKLAISTDAHHTTSLRFMRYGIGQARRGWLEPDDVINTRNWGELKTLLRRD